MQQEAALLIAGEWLREKIEDDPSNPSKLVTVRGFGYRFG